MTTLGALLAAMGIAEHTQNTAASKIKAACEKDLAASKADCLKKCQTDHTGDFRERCKEICADTYSQQLTKCITEAGDQASGISAARESLVPHLEEAYKTTQECASSLSANQTQLQNTLTQVYASNKEMFGASLQASAESFGGGTSVDPQLVTKGATISNFQSSMGTWPATATVLQDAACASILHRIIASERGSLVLPDFPALTDDEQNFQLSQEFGGGGASLTTFGDTMTNMYPVGWASLFAVILAQCELIVSEKLFIPPGAGGALTSEEENSGAVFAAINSANHAATEGSEGSATIQDVFNTGGSTFFAGNNKDLSPLVLLRHLTAAGKILKSINETSTVYLDDVEPRQHTVGNYLLSSPVTDLLNILGKIKKDSDCIKNAHDKFVKAAEKEQQTIKDNYKGTTWNPLNSPPPNVLDALDQMEQDPEEFLAEGGQELFLRKAIFKEQCWLLAYVDLLAQFKQKHLDPGKSLGTGPQDGVKEGTANKHLPYSSFTINKRKDRNANATLLVDGEPYAFMNRLVCNPLYSSYYHDIPTSELSNIQPKIRLFKVTYDADNSTLAETEINFDSHFSPAAASALSNSIKERKRRGVGVGIKSFTFSYDGGNPFAIKKSIAANLKIFANNIEELFESRGSKSEPWRYVDLALKTGGSTLTQAIDNLDPAEGAALDQECFDHVKENSDRYALNFRLKAQVGLTAPKTGPSGLGTYVDALQESYVTLNLTPTVHSFELDDMGRVVLNINFLAYIDDMFDQPIFNVFANAKYQTAENQQKSVSLARIEREMEIESFKLKCAAGTHEINEKRKEYTHQVGHETAASLSSLIGHLMVRDLVYYVTLGADEMNLFTQDGPTEAFKTLRSELSAQINGKPTPEKDICAEGGDKDSAPELLGIVSNGSQRFSNMDGRVGAAMQEYAQAYGEGETSGAILQALISGGDPNQHTLSFFFVSDLIDVILENIEAELASLPGALETLKSSSHVKASQVSSRQREMRQYLISFKKIRVLLGPAELYTVSSNGEQVRTIANLGDMPISTKYFLEWMMEKMLKKQEVFYPLTKFINDFFNDLLNNFLNNDSCFGFSIKQQTRINQAAVTAFSRNNGIDSLSAKLFQNKKPSQQKVRIDLSDGALWTQGSPLLELSGPAGSAKTKISNQHEMNYMIFFAGRVQPTELMQGKRLSWKDKRGTLHLGDQVRGINHYLLGKDRGIIKNIKLSKTQVPGLAEVRFEQDGYDGLSQLRVIYNVEITTYADVHAWPGTYIYVDPRGFSPGGLAIPDSSLDFTDLGIGGYYMIIRSEHGFGEGFAQTTIHAQWVNAIENDAKNNQCVILKEASGGDGMRRKKGGCS
tara:strand:+ start:33957 stop:37970 length:4014 start_codon:yes stop_codon:yes gene_type:complete